MGVVSIRPFVLEGSIKAPPSKSMAHRLLICASLAKARTRISNIAYSEDILATIDCLTSLGTVIEKHDDYVMLDASDFLNKADSLYCRESGSTLRFMIPLCLLLNKEIDIYGSKKLLSRPLSIYEEIAAEKNFLFIRNENHLTVKGQLTAEDFKVKGNISSQFITGLIFALCYLNEDTKITVTDKFESRSYVELTVSALNSFGFNVTLTDNVIQIRKTVLDIKNEYEVEADESNAANLDCFKYFGSSIEVLGKNPDTIQGDRVYKDAFEKLDKGFDEIDLKDCPDLGPVLIAFASLKHGCHLINTARLSIKECDRGMAMKEELEKLGSKIIVSDNDITVEAKELKPVDYPLDSHNDHRIVMALTLVLSRIGGSIDNYEAVKKSYPDYFDVIKTLKGDITCW